MTTLPHTKAGTTSKMKHTSSCKNAASQWTSQHPGHNGEVCTSLPSLPKGSSPWGSLGTLLLSWTRRHGCRDNCCCCRSLSGSTNTRASEREGKEFRPYKNSVLNPTKNPPRTKANLLSHHSIPNDGRDTTMHILNDLTLVFKHVRYCLHSAWGILQQKLSFFGLESTSSNAWCWLDYVYLVQRGKSSKI